MPKTHGKKSKSDEGNKPKSGILLAEVPRVKYEVMGSGVPGVLRFYDTGVVFAGKDDDVGGKAEERPAVVAADDVESMTWSKLAGGQYVLRVVDKDGTSHRFLSGNKDLTRVGKALKPAYAAKFEEKKMSIAGRNWGTAEFSGGTMRFNVASLPAFEIPLAQVSNCSTGKNEVVMEFHQNEAASVGLMEMRFHIPGTEANDSDEAVAAFKQRVMAHASVVSATGDALATFKEVPFITPRGRYELKIYHKFVHMHGKTFDYKIPKKTFLRLFLLPHVDQRQMFFVMNLDPPVKQGQTLYPFLICSMEKEDEMTLEIPLSEEEIKEKFGSKVKKLTTGPTYEILSNLLHALVGRRISTTGTFRGRPTASGAAAAANASGGDGDGAGRSSVRNQNFGVALACSHKAAAGYLYPLDDCFIFIHKPAVLVRHKEVDKIHFARSGCNTRSFDLEIQLKSGIGGGSAVTFSSISKDEIGPLLTYLKKFHIKVKNDQEEVDEMLQPSWEETDKGNKDHDIYLTRVLAEACGDSSSDADDDDDDDDEEDAEYDPAKDKEAMEIAMFGDDDAMSVSASSSDDEKTGRRSPKKGGGKNEKSSKTNEDSDGAKKKTDKKEKNEKKRDEKKRDEKKRDEKKRDEKKKEEKKRDEKKKEERKKDKKNEGKKETEGKKDKKKMEEKKKDDRASSSKNLDIEIKYKSKEFISASDTSSDDEGKKKASTTSTMP